MATSKSLSQCARSESQQRQLKKTEKLCSWLLNSSPSRGSLCPLRLQSDIRRPELKQQTTVLPSHGKEHLRENRKVKHERHLKDSAWDVASKSWKKTKCSGSMCSNTKVMHRPETSPEPFLSKKAAASAATSLGRKSSSALCSSSHRSLRSSSFKDNVASITPALSKSSSSLSSKTEYMGGTPKVMSFRKFSSCYECKMVIDPVLAITRDPSMRTTVCSWPDCGEIFFNAENLELHQSVRHAVSELGPEDTSRNIVEIIFQSSWLKNQTPICEIDRILKVHNTQRTISRFEEYRDVIKAQAAKHPKKHPRCAADGNELLRFYCSTMACSLGLKGASNLCSLIPCCSICNIIKNGFSKSCSLANGESHDLGQKGILTTATSGRAHDKAASMEDGSDHKKRAMLVCRVIAGRVKKNVEAATVMDDCDSVAGVTEIYANLDELYVFNPKAILPCFVVIYKGF